MVNKVALGILAVIVLTAMTVGGLVGLQLGGEGSLDVGGTPTPTPTPAASETGTSATPTPTPTATPTPTPEPIEPGEFNESRIETELYEGLNDERTSRNDPELNLRADLTEMARFHSDNMAEQGFASHGAAGYTTEERYEEFDLGDCRVPDDSNTGIRRGESLETVTKTFAGRPYETADNETRISETEREVAQRALEKWFADTDERRKLLLQEADAVGVGVTMTEEGAVYVTVNLC